MAKTVVKRIPVEAVEKLKQIDPDFRTAINKALNLPREQTRTGLTRAQKDEVEMIVDQKIEEAKRRY